MQGDQKIIAILNELLKGELTAVDQYLIHGEMYADMGLHNLAAKSLHESEHELAHARALIQRILFLEGTPNLAQRDCISDPLRRKCSKLTCMSNTRWSVI
jgi:bacterioferritin